MITSQKDIFRLTTRKTDYWLRITKFGHIEHLYYGPRLFSNAKQGSAPDFYSDTALAQELKRSAVIGSSIVYDKEDELYALDHLLLEWSGTGRGDYRHSPLEAKMPDGTFVSDFLYQSAEILGGCAKMETLPSAYGEEPDCQTLILHLKDTTSEVYLDLYYTVYETADVITRRVSLHNREDTALSIRRLSSLMLDLPDRSYEMVTFDGGWAREAHLNSRRLQSGMVVNSSTTGSSSNRHNPGFIIKEASADEDNGFVYGFNLVYSGNHCSTAELTSDGTVRITSGISSHCFEWDLKKGETFEAPEAVMTFSDRGQNGAGTQFHRFINEHIIRGTWKNKERPVLLNNWEAHFFNFDERKLLKLASQARDLGIELFVLDDGWFGRRDNDHTGLGDYQVNRKKLPGGLKSFARKIRSMGLAFGLWFEPEMINEDSDLYRSHPEYTLRHPKKPPVHGRNQLVLDLCQKEVQDYIVEQVSRTIDEAGLSYVKWDMNRHIAEGCSPCLTNQGEFSHRYILGLYSVLNRIFAPRPHVLVETCSSGGNRFDLGMLCYSQQIWASDDTDPVERLSIQGGLSFLYPLSAIGSHVSMAPHQQTLRNTPLSTRFNTAAFGCLGYELDLKYLTTKEKEEIRGQIAFYKKFRNLLQYGTFSRVPTRKGNQVSWQCVDAASATAVSGLFQTIAEAAPGYDSLIVPGLKEDRMYTVETKPQFLYIKRFGGLMKHVLPVELNPEGLILRAAHRYYALNDCVESYRADGRMLHYGILLNNQFMGSHYNEHTRLLGDFGSNLYVIREEKVNGTGNKTE